MKRLCHHNLEIKFEGRELLFYHLQNDSMKGSELMARVLRLLGMMSCLLFVFPSLADEAQLQRLVSQAKESLADHDEKAFNGLMDQLFEHITGFSALSSQLPKGISDNQYIQKMCDYARVSNQILTHEILDAMRHQTGLMAYSVVLDGEESDLYIRAMTDCVFEDGRPVPTAQFMRDGIAWAKTFQAANAEQAMSMAEDKVALASKNPQIKELATLSKLVLYDAKDKERNASTKNETPEMDNTIYHASLIDKADKGDLVAQLDVAHRLETGDKFEQNNRFAYFWYKRALQNKGGKAAQSGMDRLLPHLEKFDFMLIDMWFEKKHRPY